MSKKQLKVGDQVRLKKNLKIGNMYGKFGCLTFIDSMNFKGYKQILTTDDLGIVELRMNYCNYYYTPEMLTK